ncbi:ATP-binding cassette domain-containing protein [Frankia sp. CNm7]|uniref:ATP-binding cassette domain-containing protein n=1 Tax=Frankia nepalensis TaxID=1836974 RepID=A0A937UR52_9ACTN|nr:ATP-binding cassette domain-containing protein [Frankia nepalensis]MBL7498370.1 ATP-binding cassette domain-containing protein [Frankia nepalensis]MBL7515663.1 ATP-binding cassette domain-containing protein [Frankia nepalensis]MBL7524877.1 ATP-binding cassette domain-containing protein [Frankia nepalensis]MBL7628905.1 ATP-binding cassette domain-containing protein [Frankia nepalensis]
MITTHALRREFRRSRRAEPVVAVDGIDLNIARGEVFGLLGPNGAGKSTTMRMLTTLLPPTSGTATVAGHDLRRERAAVRRRIGFVAQGGGTDSAETARAELVMQGRVFGMSKAAALAQANELLDRFSLTEAAGRRLGTWSGGMRRRLDIAIGLVNRPELVLLDEPTTGLDPASRAEVWAEIRAVREAGTTILLTTHYLEEADELCDRVAIVDKGRIARTGTPDELKAQVAGDGIVVTLPPGAPGLVAPAVREQAWCRGADAVDDRTLRVYVDDGSRAVTDLLRLLDSLSTPVVTLTLTRPSLDDVFLTATGHPLAAV